MVLFFNGFYVFWRDFGFRRGGAPVLVKDGLARTFIEPIYDYEIVWVVTLSGWQSILLEGVYRGPQSAIDVLTNSSGFLLVKLLHISRVMLGDDFTLTEIYWERVIPTWRRGRLKLGVDIHFRTSLSQVVKCHTCMSDDGESLLDLVFLSEVVTRNVADISIAEGVSDHAMVVCHLSLQTLNVLKCFKTVSRAH